VADPAVDDLMKRRARARLRERLFGVEAEPVKVGRFVIVDSVGSGAMGTVYAAYDPDLDRKVAVKLIRPDLSTNEVSRQRLIREARAMARLSHPNVISVHDVGTVDGTVFFAMELVDGVSLRSWLAAGPRSWRDIVGVFIQAGRGLEAAHAVGLIHRDFKPDNVLVRNSGRVQVLDFGVAWVVDTPEDELVSDSSTDSSEISSERGASLTRTGGMVGTPRYMAPEQHAAAATDPRTDQFSFCVALWEALYGETPFGGTTVPEVALAVLDGELREPRSERGVPRRIRRALERGMASSPTDRYPSMTELLAELARDPARTRRAVAVAGVCALAVGVGIFGMSRRRDITTTSAAMCSGGAGTMRAHWNNARADALRRQFASTKARGAVAIAERASHYLGGYANRWVSAYTQACLDGARHENSAKLMDVRMVCLEQRRVHFEAVAALLDKADARVVRNALHAVHSLPSLARCADLNALIHSVAPPEDPALRKRVHALRERLAGVRALRLGGKYAEGLNTAQALWAEVVKLEYKPIVAAVLLELGRMETKRGKYEQAKTYLERAYFMALSSKADEVACEAAVGLVRVIGVDLAHHDEALVWVNHAASVIKRYEPNGALAALLAEAHANVLERAGKPALAEARYRDAIRLRERLGGGLGLAAALNGLAFVLESRGRFDEALALHKRSLALTDKYLGPDHPNTIVAYNGVATSLAKRRDFKHAEVMMRQVLARIKRGFGPDHANVATVTNNLGIVNWELGRYQAALALFRKALAIHEHNLGPDHPAVARVLNNMGLVYGSLGRYAEALKVYKRALAIEAKRLRPGHPRLAHAKNNIAGVYSDMGKLDLAKAQYEQALAIASKALGPEHPSVAYSLNGLGSVYLRKRDYARARTYYTRALAIWKRAYGADSQILAHPHANLGNVMSSLGRYADAEKHYLRAQALWRKHLGDNHPYTIGMLTTLGNLYRRWKQPARALPLFRQAVAAQVKRQGPDHPDVAYALVGLADTYVDLKQYAKAVAPLRRAIAIRTRAKVDPPRIGEAQFSLAEALMLLGKPSQAVALARTALANYKKGQQPAPDLEAWLKRHHR